MQLSSVTYRINEGKQEFQNNTYFLANYIKVNLVTWALLREFISEDGMIQGLTVIIDYDIEDRFAKIGLGNGPTFSTIKF